MRALRVPKGIFNAVGYSADGQYLLGIHSGWRLRIWDLTTRRQTHVTDLPVYIRVAALSPDGRYLAYVVHDEQHSPGEILFWDIEFWTSAGRLEWNLEDAIMDLAFSPEGQTLATISQAGVVKLWPWRLLLR